MTDAEMNEVRRILLAFEDAATWCEQLAEMVMRGLPAEQPHDDPSGAGATRRAKVAEILKRLQADRSAVGWVRTRIGLPPV